MSKKSSKRERPAETAANSAIDAGVSPAKSKTVLYFGLGLFALVFLLYGRVAGFPLIRLDDDRYITNLFTQQGLTLDSIRWAFTGDGPPYWHPLTWLSHMLDADLFGAGSLGGPHMMNVLLHALNSVLVLLLLRRLTGKVWESGVVALLFAVHPLRVESVVWLAERKDVLCAFFFLLATYAHARYASRTFSLMRYAAVLAAGMCAMMAKPMAVTLPFVLLLLDWWPLGRVRDVRKCVMEKLPLFAFSGLTIWNILNSGATEASSSITGLTFGGQIANAITAYARYLLATLWPYPLAVIYPYSTAIPMAVVALAAVVVLTVTAVAVLQRERRPYLIIGWLWFLGMLVPVIGFIQSGMQSRADRFTYLPHVGLLMAVVLLVSEMLDGRPDLTKQALGIAGVIAVVFAGVSWVRLGNWADPATLYAHDLAVTGDNPRLQLQYGTLLLNEGKAPEAEMQFRAVVNANPQANAARISLANALGMQKKFTDAAVLFREVVKQEPNSAEGFMGLATAEMNAGTKDDALSHFQAAIRMGLPPARAAQAHNNMGVIYMERKQPQEAFSQFREAITADPRLLSAHRNIALALIQTNQTLEAAQYIARAIETLGEDPVLVNLRNSLTRTSAPAGK